MGPRGAIVNTESTGDDQRSPFPISHLPSGPSNGIRKVTVNDTSPTNCCKYGSKSQPGTLHRPASIAEYFGIRRLSSEGRLPRTD